MQNLNKPSRNELAIWASYQRHKYCRGQLSAKKIERLKNVGFRLNTNSRQLQTLAEANPALAAEWHPTKNGNLKPTDVAAGSNKKVWWLCSNGHEWEAYISTRNNQGNSCPVCIGKKVQAGFNDLATINPTMAAEWHPIKNGALRPTEVSANSGKKVWWQCNKGHEWKCTVSNRKRGDNCPFCSGHRVWVNYNDLASVNPGLAAEWHPTKNGVLKPTDVSTGSNIKVWWQCSYGHEWQAIISSRSNGGGCPYCAGKKVLSGFNDLSTTNPELAAEWHPSKNGNLKSIDVTVGSGKKVWWQCNKGHEWQASIVSRKKGNGCPYCAGKKAITGFNDLATTNPELVTEWHPTKNGNLKPTDVKAGSGKKVWWQCNKGHEWEAAIVNRSAGRGCPHCYYQICVKNLKLQIIN